MKKSLLFLFLITGALSSSAQTDSIVAAPGNPVPDTIWRRGGIAALSFNQVSLSNWAAGGDNSIGGNALLSLFANMKNGKWVWDNTLDLAFGAAKVGHQDWRKSDDKIDLNTKVGYDIGNHFYVTYMLGFKTQFTEGFNYLGDTGKIRISNFMTPGYILNSLGIDWKPNDNLSLFLSPVTAKTTILTDETLIHNAELAGISLYGVDPGEKVRNEFGAYFRGLFKQQVMENILFSTKLELFSNYANDPQNIDVNWEVILAMKVNKYITVLLTTQLLYDNDVFIIKDETNLSGGPGTQFKETFGLGFSYKFQGFGIR
jgi:hypothetical protein